MPPLDAFCEFLQQLQSCCQKFLLLFGMSKISLSQTLVRSYPSDQQNVQELQNDQLFVLLNPQSIVWRIMSVIPKTRIQKNLFALTK